MSKDYRRELVNQICAHGAFECPSSLLLLQFDKLLQNFIQRFLSRSFSSFILFVNMFIRELIRSYTKRFTRLCLWAWAEVIAHYYLSSICSFEHLIPLYLVWFCCREEHEKYYNKINFFFFIVLPSSHLLPHFFCFLISISSLWMNPITGLS